MTIANLGWGLDQSTWLVIPMAEWNNGGLWGLSNQGDTPSLVASGLVGMGSASISGGGLARWWRAGQNLSYTFPSLPGGLFSTGSSTAWTVDCLVQKTSSVGTEMGLWDFRKASDVSVAPFFLRIGTDGSFRFRAITKTATYDLLSVATLFPRINDTHVRLTYDFAAGQARLYLGDVGVVPTLAWTFATDTTSFTNQVDELFIGNMDDALMGRFRVVATGSVDAYPIFGSGGSTAVPLSASAASGSLSGKTLSFSWSRAVVDEPGVRSAGAYVVSASAGPAMSVASVASVSGASESLALSVSDLRSGGSYVLSFPSGTAYAQDDGTRSLSGSLAFTMAGVPFPSSSVAVTVLSPSSFQATYVKPVVHVSSAGANDALNPSNYVVAISGSSYRLAVSSVQYVGSTDDSFVVVTEEMPPGRALTLAVRNVQDLAGNVI